MMPGGIIVVALHSDADGYSATTLVFAVVFAAKACIP